MKDKICMFTGAIGAKEFALLEKYAMQQCTIVLMDKNKEMGNRVKTEFERKYHVPVFFFHGDVESEEDRDLFEGAVREMYGQVDFIVCSNQ